MKTYSALFAYCLSLSVLMGCAHFGDDGKNQERAKVYLQLAAENLNKKEFGPALENTQKAIELDPQFAAAYNHLALVYLESNRPEKAKDAFGRALEIRPDYPEVYNNRGVLNNRLGNYKDAISDFRKALDSANYNTPENALTNLGVSFYKLGNFAKSKTYHQQALDVAPNFCLAFKNLGDVYASEKKYSRAVRNYESAVQHCPLYEESHYKYGLALLKLGKTDLAKQTLEKLILRHKQGPYVDKSTKVLDQIKKSL